MQKLSNKILKEISYHNGSYLVPPEFLSLIITMHCNFRCRSCAIWQKEDYDELDQDDWQKIINQLTQTLKPHTFIEINGGEPLIRKDLTLFLIKELKKYFSKITLNSNGLLIDEKIIQELKSSGLDTIKISFYSLDAKTHNNLRGHELAYTHARNAIEIINKNKMQLEIGLLITSQNIKDAPSLIKYLEALPNTSIILQPLDERIESRESKKQDDNNLISELWPQKEDVNIFFDYVLRHNQKIKNSLANIEAIRQYYLDPENILKYRCFAGQRSLVIYPNGDLSFCFKGEKFGNILKKDLKKILQKNTTQRRKIKKCKKYCRIIGCNFSRGLKEFIWNK